MGMVCIAATLPVIPTLFTPALAAARMMDLIPAGQVGEVTW